MSDSVSQRSKTQFADSVSHWATAKLKVNRNATGLLIVAAIAAICFAPAGWRPVLGAEGAEKSDAARAVALELLERMGIRRGVCAVVGFDDDVALELAKSSELLVHVREESREKVEALRQRADEAGLGIDRFVAEQGRLEQLPYADNIVDVVVTQGAVPDAELLRVLRPRGTAFIRGEHGGTRIENDLNEARADVKSFKDATGSWLRFTKPALDGAGDWSHWEHGPDNNPVSTDTVIKAPYMTQFMAEPFYIPIPSITTAAGGRTFLAVGHIAHHRREWNMLNKLIARNGYNGTQLWERDLPERYLVHRSAFIATKDTFYMLDGDRCLLLDPEFGEEIGEIRIDGVTGQWKWMVLNDGILYVMAGKKDPGAEIMKGDRSFGGWSWGDMSKGYYGKPHVPWGFGNTLVAYELATKRVVWKHTEEHPIDSRALSMGDDRISLYCPSHHLRCLDLATGKVRWTNDEKDVLDLIEEPGKGLTSTPGFRSACMSVFTPDALIIQGQTRMNVLAISPKDGYMLWSKKKVTNNPNAIFIDGNIVLGVGPGGSHVVVDPETGNVLEDLKFRKRACTRLTASSDSLFVRGEGMLRFDRAAKKVLVDGAVRPACNDGALPANGLLYLGPWQCDCNLSLIGRVARCSAGDFQFDHVATEADRLEQIGQADASESFPVSENDWPTYRANNQRSGGSLANVADSATQMWQHVSDHAQTPTAPVSAGGVVFVGGRDGKVRAIDGSTGELRWQFRSPAEIKASPTIAAGKVYFGSCDGFAYAVDAATGKLVWRFRAAPVERHIMTYGLMSSTWPVNSGVLVQDGVAYFAAGIVDHDGTYVYAVDADTGKIKWQNNSSGHLNEELRKGVSVQGNLTIQGDRLLLAGGNQVSPAAFDLQTGECLAEPFDQGNPKANNGRYIGVFGDRYALAGGRILYSAAQNVSSKGSFTVHDGDESYRLSHGGIPPAWDENTFAVVNYLHGKVTASGCDKVAARFEKGYPDKPKDRPRHGDNLTDALVADEAVLWQSNLGESSDFEAVALAVCPNAVVAVAKYQDKFRAHPQWFVVAFDTQTGAPRWRQEIRGEPLPDGLLIDAKGQVILSMLDGRVVCFGQKG